MEIKNITEAKIKLTEILDKENLSQGDHQELKEILTTLYKIETNSQEINIAKISNTFKKILLIQNSDLQELTKKIIKLWKNTIYAPEKINTGTSDKSKEQKVFKIEKLKNDSSNVELTSTLTLDLNENSLNEEDKIKYFKQKIQTEERDPTRRNTKILIYDGFFKSQHVKSDSKLQNPQIIYNHTNQIEACLSEANITSDKKDKYLKQTKSIVLNLYNNINFVKEIFEGNITPEELSIMEPKDMASEEIKTQREKLKEEAFNARRSDWHILHASNKPGIFRCGKCRSNHTTYYQLQIRRADEPMTTFITCLSCSHGWRQ